MKIRASPSINKLSIELSLEVIVEKRLRKRQRGLFMSLNVPNGRAFLHQNFHLPFAYPRII